MSDDLLAQHMYVIDMKPALLLPLPDLDFLAIMLRYNNFSNFTV